MIADLNCDLGEGEPCDLTAGLLKHVTSANVACGGHAGDDATMRAVLAEAFVRGVRVGAHPGVPGGFGRDRVELTPGQLDDLLQQQIRRLAHWAVAAGVRLTHVKLHGSLYYAVNRDRKLAEVALRRVGEELPASVMFAPPTGWLSERAVALGIGIWPEGFADRGYRDDGMLVPRDQPEALLTDPVRVRERIRTWQETGAILSVNGVRLPLPVRTWCVHGDTPGAVGLAECVRKVLEKAV